MNEKKLLPAKVKFTEEGMSGLVEIQSLQGDTLAKFPYEYKHASVARLSYAALCKARAKAKQWCQKHGYEII